MKIGTEWLRRKEKKMLVEDLLRNERDEKKNCNFKWKWAWIRSAVNTYEYMCKNNSLAAFIV